MNPQESLANVEIYCSSEKGKNKFKDKLIFFKETQTFYVHDFLLKFRWKSLYSKLSQQNSKVFPLKILSRYINPFPQVKVKIEPKLLGLILEFIYSGELVLNHLSVKELLSLLDFTIKQDIEFIVSLILNHLLLSTPTVK